MAGDYLFPPLRFYKKWLTRTTDLEGVRRAAVVTTLMREQEIVAEDVPGFLEGSEFRDPYTDGSFDWDPDEREVMFDGLRDDRYDVYRLPF